MVLSIDLGHSPMMAVLMQGDIPVKHFEISAPAAEKGRINNMQETAAAISEALKANKVTTQQCVFVLPSTAVVSKEMEVPETSRADILKIVRSNFSTIVETGEDQIVDYLPLKKSNPCVVLGVLARKTLVTQCMTLAKNAKLKCKRVELHVSAVRKYWRQRNIQETTIVVCADSKQAEINLFDEELMFIRRVELEEQTQQDNLLKNWAMSFNDNLMQGQQESTSAELLADQIRNILQFQLSRNGQAPVKKVFLYGNVDEWVLREIERKIMTPVEALNKDPQLLPYVNAIGAGLSMRGQELDLLAELNRKTPAEAASLRRTATFGAVVFAVVAAGLTAGATIAGYSNDLLDQATVLEQHMAAPQTRSLMTRARNAKKLAELSTEYNAVLSQFQEYFDDVYRLESESVKLMFEQADFHKIQLSFWRYDRGQLTMSCRAGDSVIAAEFAKSLQQLGLADAVTFTGYVMDGGTQATYGYRFELTAELKGAILHEAE